METEWMGVDDDEEEKSGVRQRTCVSYVSD